MSNVIASSALAPIANNPSIDNWDVAGDEISPVRGLNIKFDGGAFFTGKEKMPVDENRKFIVIDRAEGWQFLKKDCPAEWLMREPGDPRPEQPFVAESEQPIGLNGKPQHPWKWTYFVYLLDAATGETCTFSSSTNGGRVAVGDLTSQIKYMRRMKPGAVPIVTLESRQMKTKFGTKPRPHFRIQGWKVRDDDQPKLIGINRDDGGVAEVSAFDDEMPF